MERIEYEDCKLEVIIFDDFDVVCASDGDHDLDWT